jgi:hypothetical protein
VLGTPSSGTATNLTGLPISTGVSGLGTGVATALAVNVGSAGAAVVNGGALGTPSGGTATNLTGLPLTTGVTGQLPVANGGTGTATPSIVAGTNVTVTGTWPNQTIASSAGGSGTVTSVDVSGGTTGLTTSGGPVTSSGTVTLAGTLAVANGGTGQTSYTDGQLLIGNSTGNTLTKATLTAGTNVTITNAAGAITIAASGGGASAATPTVLGTVYGKQTTSGGTPYLTAYGYSAGTLTTGIENVAFGVQALELNVTGTNNTMLGTYAGSNNTNSFNVAVGSHALRNNTSGANNIAIGYATLVSNSTNSNNVGVGHQALNSSTASGNTAVGYQASYSNTTGGGNVSVGYEALKNNVTGANNTSVGFQALSLNTASDNVAVGEETLYANTSGVSNTGVGRLALTANTTGNANVGIGRNALPAITTAEQNVGVGNSTLESVTTGFYNTSCGHRTGRTLATGSYNLYLGSYANASSSTVNYEINIQATSADTPGKGGSTAFISAGGGGTYNGANTTTWATTSDQRLKKNIVDNNIGLEKLTQIQVRNFEYRLPEEVDAELKPTDAIKKSGVQLGVIAQELKAVLPECVKTETTGVMSVDADNLTWYLINAVKELSARVKQLEGN